MIKQTYIHCMLVCNCKILTKMNINNLIKIKKCKKLSSDCSVYVAWIVLVIFNKWYLFIITSQFCYKEYCYCFDKAKTWVSESWWGCKSEKNLFFFLTEGWMFVSTQETSHMCVYLNKIKCFHSIWLTYFWLSVTYFLHTTIGKFTAALIKLCCEKFYLFGLYDRIITLQNNRIPVYVFVLVDFPMLSWYIFRLNIIYACSYNYNN